MPGFSAYLRLAGVAVTLVRADALAPAELDPVLPAGPRAFARLARLFRAPGTGKRRPGERLADALERLGPVGVKLGQFLSTRADVFGLVFAADLSRLKDQLAPFPLGSARAEVA